MHTGQYMFFIWLFSLYVAQSESKPESMYPESTTFKSTRAATLHRTRQDTATLVSP